MGLTSRITLSGPPATDPEDFISDSLGVLWRDDVQAQHGDADHGLAYESPHLPRALRLGLADPAGEEERSLQSHYLWNSSLLMAEMLEAATLVRARARTRAEDGEPKLGGMKVLGNSEDLAVRDAAVGFAAGKSPGYTAAAANNGANGHGSHADSAFDITAVSTIELGAGTALPSLLAALLGAARVVITDYPSPAILSNLAANVERNVTAAHSPFGRVPPEPVTVRGHAWGDLPPPAPADGRGLPPSSNGNGKNGSVDTALRRGAFARVLVCDCLWMPWQHANLLRSIGYFLASAGDDASARCLVVAGFHTGRDKVAAFFEPARLRRYAGLEAERVWERDCDGAERAWVADRGVEDVAERKRWLVVGVLRRIRGGEDEDEDEDEGEGEGAVV